MRQYGKKKQSTHIPGHQNCAICREPHKNLKTRARREGKKEIVRSMEKQGKKEE